MDLNSRDPTDYEAGTDFVIRKSLKAQYADYSTSNWVLENVVRLAERDAIAKHGLFNSNDVSRSLMQNFAKRNF